MQYSDLAAFTDPLDKAFQAYSDIQGFLAKNAPNFTALQQLKLASNVTQLHIRKQSYEELLGVWFEKDSISILFTCYKVIQRPGRDILTEKGLRSIVFQLTEEDDLDTWTVADQLTVWETDPEFKPVIQRLWGGQPPEYNHLEKLNWEKMCHRPGASSYPLDSYERTLEFGATESPKMRRHWHLNTLAEDQETDS